MPIFASEDSSIWHSMVKKVNHIKEFGTFNDFSWSNELDDFKKLNLIYGWNYSGKTTLSRVFRCLEVRSAHPDYQEARFQMELVDATKLSEKQLSSSPLEVRVFNTDFINENFKWDGDISPLFLLGKDNIELQAQIDTLTNSKQNKQKRCDELVANINEKEKALSDASTTEASRIKTELHLLNYTKAHLDKDIPLRSKDFQSWILEDEQLIKAKKSINSIEKKDELSTVVCPTIDFTIFNKSTEALLKKSIVSNTIQHLVDNPTTALWVKDGIEIHEGKEFCEFCSERLPDNRIERLSAHFSKDYELLQTEIDSLILEIENAIESLDIVLIEKTAVYSYLIKEYDTCSKLIVTESLGLRTQLIELQLKLNLKKTNPFKQISHMDAEGDCSGLQAAISSLNTIIESHNKTTEEFDKQKADAVDKLKKHLVSSFILSIKYFDSEKQITALKAEQDILSKNISEVSAEIIKLDNQISEIGLAADKIGEYLAIAFNKVDLQIRPEGQNKFRLYRGAHHAKNLSEGEKTAIAFAYFMTRLEDKSTNLEETVVFLDDPISSLDINHLYNTYGFIKAHLSKCKQLFISTHNYDLFSIVRYWLKDNSKESAMFLIERNHIDNEYSSRITRLPFLLLTYESEYTYLFSLIHAFNNNATPSHQEMLNMPNILRRFLEMFTGLKYPDGEGLTSKYSRFIKSKYDEEKIKKILDTQSHGRSINRAFMFPATQEYKDVVKVILKSIESVDKEHYDSLLISVRKAAQSAATHSSSLQS